MHKESFEPYRSSVEGKGMEALVPVVAGDGFWAKRTGTDAGSLADQLQASPSKKSAADSASASALDLTSPAKKSAADALVADESADGEFDADALAARVRLQTSTVMRALEASVKDTIKAASEIVSGNEDNTHVLGGNALHVLRQRLALLSAVQAGEEDLHSFRKKFPELSSASAAVDLQDRAAGDQPEASQTPQVKDEPTDSATLPLSRDVMAKVLSLTVLRQREQALSESVESREETTRAIVDWEQNCVDPINFLCRAVSRMTKVCTEHRKTSSKRSWQRKGNTARHRRRQKWQSRLPRPASTPLTSKRLQQPLFLVSSLLSGARHRQCEKWLWIPVISWTSQR